MFHFGPPRAQQQENRILLLSLSFRTVGPLPPVIRSAEVPLMERMAVLLSSETKMRPLRHSVAGSRSTGTNYAIQIRQVSCLSGRRPLIIEILYVIPSTTVTARLSPETKTWTLRPFEAGSQPTGTDYAIQIRQVSASQDEGHSHD